MRWVLLDRAPVSPKYRYMLHDLISWLKMITEANFKALETSALSRAVVTQEVKSGHAVMERNVQRFRNSMEMRYIAIAKRAVAFVQHVVYVLLVSYFIDPLICIRPEIEKPNAKTLSCD